MGHHEVRVIGHTGRVGDGLPSDDELVGDDSGCGDAGPVQQDAIVHTARRAGPSVAYAGYNSVGPGLHIRHHFFWWGQGGASLPVAHDLLEVVLLV